MSNSTTPERGDELPGNDSFTTIAPYYDQLMASVPYRFWLSYIEALWKTHGVIPRRVIDLACGTGTVSLLLADKGIEVVGIDRSPGMIEQAERKAAERGITAEFLVADAIQMEPVQPPADSVICLFDSLNNIVDYDDLTAALKAIKLSLVDNGLLIFDLNTAYAFRQGMFNQRSSPMDTPLRYVWRSKYDEPSHLCTVTMDFEIIVRGIQPARKFTEVHVQRAYNRVEIEEILQSVGFSEIVSYDAYTLFPPKKRSDRIFWVAR